MINFSNTIFLNTTNFALFYPSVFFISLIGVYLFRGTAIKYNIIANPNFRTSHEVPLPKGGGIVFSVVFVFGVFSLTQAMLPFFKKSGHVVNISSMGGVQGSAKFPGLAAYSSSKGALITLTELLAEEFKQTGPSFNVLALGAVQTEMLEEAFPGYEAPLTATQMAAYIIDFSLTGHTFYNGKVLEVSSSTP